MSGEAVTGNDDDPRVYIRIETLVREQITGGKLRPGARTPPIKTFCTQFRCARETAGKAMRALAREGLLVRYPGLGYYVASQPVRPAPRQKPEGQTE